MIDLLRELPAKADRSLFKVERWCTPDEGMALYTLVQAHGIRTVLESGTANGYSALWMAHAGADVHTWDVHERPKIWEHTEFSAAGVKCHVGPFDEGVTGARGTPGPRLYFIDGEHDRLSVRKDWRAVRQLIQPGDVIALHDIATVDNIQELLENLKLIHGYRTGLIRTARGLGVAFA